MIAASGENVGQQGQSRAAERGMLTAPQGLRGGIELHSVWRGMASRKGQGCNSSSAELTATSRE